MMQALHRQPLSGARSKTVVMLLQEYAMKSRLTVGPRWCGCGGGRGRGSHGPSLPSRVRAMPLCGGGEAFVLLPAVRGLPLTSVRGTRTCGAPSTQEFCAAVHCMRRGGRIASTDSTQSRLVGCVRHTRPLPRPHTHTPAATCPTQVSPTELPPPSNAGPFRFRYALMDAYGNAFAFADGPVGSWG